MYRDRITMLPRGLRSCEGVQGLYVTEGLKSLAGIFSQTGLCVGCSIMDGRCVMVSSTVKIDEGEGGGVLCVVESDDLTVLSRFSVYKSSVIQFIYL